MGSERRWLRGDVKIGDCPGAQGPAPAEKVGFYQEDSGELPD